jgi:hypothetical protein
MGEPVQDAAFQDWIAKAKAMPTLAVAERLGFRPKPSTSTFEKAGPCPAPGCGGDDRFAIALKGKKTGVFNCRGCGITGSDGVGLMMAVRSLGFLEACEELAGPRPGAAAGTAGSRPARPTEQLARTQGRDAYTAGIKDSPYGPDAPDLFKAWMAGHLEAAAEAREALRRRDGERGRAYDIWREGGPIQGTPVETYLAGRHLGLAVQWKLRLRCHPALPYWHGGVERGRYPAMLAAMVRNDGVFAGVHQTWLAPDGRGKLALVDPATGEVLPAKKMRGEKRGCHIELLRAVTQPERLVIGEGIENVLAAMLLVQGGPLWPKTTFWTACDLNNLGGPSHGSVPHPLDRVARVLKDGQTAAPVPRMVPGPEPAERADWPAIAPPPSVLSIVILGDGDSDPFMTRNVVERARRRWLGQGFAPQAVFADDGMDFNDMWRHRMREVAA